MAHGDIGSPLTDQEIDDLLHEYVHSNPASLPRTPPLSSASVEKMKSKSPTPGNGKRVHIDAPNSARRSVKDEDPDTSAEASQPARKSARTKKRVRSDNAEGNDDQGRGSSSKKKVVRRGSVAAWEPEEDQWFWRDVLEQYVSASAMSSD